MQTKIRQDRVSTSQPKTSGASGGIVSAMTRWPVLRSGSPAVFERRRWVRNSSDEKQVDGLNSIASPKSLGLYGLIKRSLDILLASAALVVLSPLMVAIALAIKLTSRGPVIFSHDRVGLGGRIFRMYKFRSMVINAEGMKESLKAQNELAGPAFKIRRDPRLTKIGGFLRKHSLDELPQLFNVLRGDMAIVGPRPQVPQEVIQCRRWQARRYSVVPGLTCIWQTSGRNNVSFEDWMRMDIRYVENPSFRLDMQLLFKTFHVVITGDGAY